MPEIPRLTGTCRLALSAAALAGLAVVATGAQQQRQENQRPRVEVRIQVGQGIELRRVAGQDDAALAAGQEIPEGVFVRDSAIAIDQFALGERLERLGDWSKAADVYQDVLEQYGDRLMASRIDEQGRILQYASVSRAVQQKLAEWPAEGRDIYEQKFGVQAQRLLEQATATEPADVERLHEIVRLYFITDAARQAGLRLVDLHLARGQFASAQRVAQELLASHPALGQQRPALLLRGAIAAHFMGDSGAARAFADELRQQFPEAQEQIAGEPQALADVARTVLESEAPARAESAAGKWPSFAGSDDRMRLAPSLSSQIAPYVQDIRLPQSFPGGRAPEVAVRRELENARRNGQLNGIFPVAYDGALYWSDNTHIFAIALDSGLPLPGWQETYGGGELPGYRLPGGGYVTPRGTALTPVVTDRFVIANMGLRDPLLYLSSGQPESAPAQIVCLDRLTGRSVWSRQPNEVDARLLGDASLKADLSECRFVGTPLVVGEGVWSLARTDPTRGRQFEQSFLVCLDLATGQPRSITYLASSAREGGPRHDRSRIPPEPDSLLAYADGLIYAPTDTGALAAVRASDGGVEWLNLYPRIAVDPLRARRVGISRRSFTESQPFHASPVIVDGGNVFFKPPDSSHVFIWNASDGREVARVDLAQAQQNQRLEGDRTLLKVIGDRILTFGSRGVSCIDWTQVRDGATALEALKWDTQIPATDRGAAIMGRPAVTASQVLIPGPNHLFVVDLNEEGRVVATYPPGGTSWAENEEPGNVIVIQDQLVIAGSTRLNVYADSGVIRQRLMQQVAENPRDPAPLLRLAQIAFVNGEFDTVVERLRQAERAAQQLAEAQVAHGMVFTTTLGFAQTLQERLNNVLAPGNPTPVTVDRFYTLAEQMARTPAQNARVRFARAAFSETEGGTPRRVALLQEILADEAWRQVPTVPGSAAISADPPSPRQAGEVARELIGQIIARDGRAAYEQIERRAALELADASAAGDIAALQRLAEVYPNSDAAEQALAEAARLLRQQDRPHQAIATLRQLAARSANPVNHWLALAQIEATRPGRLEFAAGRLRRAARVAPDQPAPEISLPDGRQLEGLNVAQAAFELTEMALAEEARTVPDFGLPGDPHLLPFEADAHAIPGVDAILPVLEKHDRHDRLALRMADGTLAVFEFGSAQPLWTAELAAGAVEEVAWLPEGLLAWGPAGVSLFEAETGRLSWTATAEALSSARLLAGAEHGAAIVAPGWSPGATTPAEESPDADLELAAIERAMQLQARGIRPQPQGPRLQEIAQARRELGREGDQAPAAGAADGPAIAGVVPRSGMIGVVIADRLNSVAGVATEDGSVLWRAPVPEGAIVAARGSGDYLAVQTQGTRTAVSVLDMDQGLLRARRHFDLAGNDPLVNFLITPENELVFMTRSRLVGIDLDGDPRSARFTIGATDVGENALAFGVGGGPGRMAVVGGKLLVLADPATAARRDAVVIDLATGQPEKFTDQATQQPTTLVLTAGRAGDREADAAMMPGRQRVQQQMRQQQRRREAERAMATEGARGERLWTAGTSVYLAAERGLSGYDLLVPGLHWWRLNAPEVQTFDPAVNLDLAIGERQVLLFDQPQATARRQVREPIVRVTAFSRQRLPDGRESGQQLFVVELAPGKLGLEAPVAAWQAMSGGLAVLDESGRLLFLRGTGE